MSSYLFSALAALVVAMQIVPTSPAARKKNPSPLMTLTGCVSRDAATTGAYTFSDTRTGAKYRLSGGDRRKDARKWGEVTIGTGARSVTIRGGLLPSPNVAAQAGAMDPAQVAVASLPGGPSSGTGSTPLPEFQVARMQAFSGSCP